MSKKLKELRQKVADLKAAGREKSTRLDEIDAMAADALTDEIKAEAEKLAAEVADLMDQVSAADQEREALENKLERDRSFAGTPAPRAGANRVYDANPALTYGFASLAEYGSAVRAACVPNGRVDDRLFGPEAGMSAALPDGAHRETGEHGYLVPPTFRDEVWQAVEDADDPLMNEVDIEPTATNAVSQDRDETTPWGASGVSASWGGEGAKMTASQLEEKSEVVKCLPLNAYVIATDDLLSDAPRLRNRLGVKAGQAINWTATAAIIEGNGVGRPLGWRNSAAYIKVAKETGQAAKTVVAENVANMYSRLLPAGIGRSFWMANSDVLPQLMTMKIGDHPIWTPPSTGFTNAPGGFLLGRPIRLSEHCETLGTAGDLELIDPKGYFSPRKEEGITFAESMHLFFDHNATAFRWTFRMGGQPHLSKPVQPNKGDATKSHFVGLATRS